MNKALDSNQADTTGYSGAEQPLEPGLIYEIGRSLSAMLDLDALLTKVVEAAVSLTQSEEGLLLLPDADSGELTIRAAKNVEDELVRRLRLPTNDSLAGQVMRTCEPILVNNDTGWEKIKTEYLVRSLVYVPLIARGEPIGVLGVDNKVKSIAFSHDDREILSTLASYAAIAIENAQLYEDAVTRARELALLAETASAVSSTLDLNQVLSTISRQIAKGLELDRCRIALWNPLEGVLHTLTEYRAIVHDGASGSRRDLSLYPQTLRLLRQGKPLTVDVDSESDDPSEQILLEKLGAHHKLALPLTVGDETIGLVEIYRDEPSAPPFEPPPSVQLRQAIRQLPPLLLASHTTDSWREDILHRAEAIFRAAEADWCSILLWDADSGTLHEVIEHGTYSRDRPSDSLDRIFPSMDAPLYREVLVSRHAVGIHMADPHLSRGHRMLLEKARAQTLLIAPLVFKGQTIGLLELGDSSHSRTFSNRELKLVGALADHAATAIENARLFGALEQSILDLQAAQSQLVQSARLSVLGELAAVVAHQIKNPLTTILGDAEIITQDLPADHPNHDSAAAILRAGQRARTVVDRLLNMAQPATSRQLVHVNATIEAVLALVSSQLQANGNQLEVDLAPNLPQIAALTGQMEDVWLNLLLNARDTLHETGPGTVSISSALAPEEDAIEVTIRDSGAGIPPQHMERIFDPFFTTKPHGKGTGLGLYICQQIVEHHQGRIDISSMPGRGTTVTVWLPLSDISPQGK